MNKRHKANNSHLSDDIDGVRKTLVLSICQAIWHYFRLTKHPEERDNITLPSMYSHKEYPATSSKVLEMIKTLICLPYDLL